MTDEEPAPADTQVRRRGESALAAESDAWPRPLAALVDAPESPEDVDGAGRRAAEACARAGEPAAPAPELASDAWPRRATSPGARGPDVWPAARTGSHTPGSTLRPPAPEPRRAPPRRVPGRRRRLALAVGLGLVVLAVVLRLLLWLLLPGVLARAARGLELDLRIERLELGLARGELRLGGVVVRPLEGGEPLLELDSARVDVTTAELLRGKVRVAEVSVDGLRAQVEREADGTFALARRLARAGAGDAAPADATAPPEAPATPPEAPRLPDLGFLRVDAVALRGLQLRLVDRSLPGAPVRVVTAEASLTDLVVAHDAPPARLLVTLACPPGAEAVLREARLEGRLALTPRRAGLRLGVRVEALSTASAAPWLAPLGVAPVASRLDLAADLRADVAPSLARGEGLALSLGLSRLTLQGDGRELAALDLAALEVAAVGSASLEVSDLVVAGVRARLARRADGALEALGVELRPRARTVRGGEAPPGPAAPPAPLPVLVVRSARLHGVALALDDAAVTPRASTRLVVDEARLFDLVLDPSRPDVPLGVDLRLRLPGVVGTLELHGDATLLAARPSARVDVTLDGLRSDLLAGYLRPLGIVPTLAAGRVTAALEVGGVPTPGGGLADGALRLRELVLADGVAPLASLALVQVDGVAFDPAARSLRVGRVTVEGPSVRLGREAGGALTGLGLRLEPAPVGSAAPVGLAPDAAAPPPAPGASPLARVELGGLRLGGLQVAWTDAAAGAQVELEDGGVELGPLALALEGPAPAPAPTPVRAWVELPGAGGRLEVRGDAVASPSAPGVRLDVVGTDLSFERLRPYLPPGVTIELARGSLAASLAASARRVGPEGLDAEVALDRLALRDGARPLLTIDGVAVRGAKLRPGAVEVERVDLGRTRAAVELLEVDGRPGVALLGLRLGGAPAPSGGEAAPVASAAAPAAPAVLPRVTVGAVRLESLQVDLRDARPTAGPDGPLPPLDLPLRLEADVGPLVLEPDGEAPPARLHAAVDVAGVASRLAVDGTLSVALPVGRPRLSARLALRGDGLQAGPLAARLRRLGLEAGFAGPATLGLQASATLAVEGERLRAGAELRGLALADEVEEWAGVDAVVVRGVDVAPTASGSLALSVGGVEVERPRLLARREPDGALVVAGLRLRGDAAAIRSDGATDAPPTPGAPPELALGGLQVTGATLRWDDHRPGPAPGADAAPLESRVQLEARLDATVGPLRVGRDAPSAPLSLGVTVPGLVGALRVDGVARLDPDDLSTRLALRAGELGLAPLAPYLPPSLGLDLTAGTLRAELTARLVRRESGAIAAQVRVAEVALADGARLLLAWDELVADVSRIDSRVVRIDRLSLGGLEAGVRRSAEGDVSLLGLVLRATPPADDASTPPADDASTPPADDEAPAPVAPRRGALPFVEVDVLDVELRQAELVRAGDAPLTVSARLRSEAPFRLGGASAAEHAPARLVLEAAAAPVVSRVSLRLAVAPFAVEPSLDATLEVDGLRGAGIAEVASELLATLDPRGLVDGRLRAHLGVALRPSRSDPLDLTWLRRGFGADVTLDHVALRDGPEGEVLAGLDELTVDVARVGPGPIVVRTVELGRPVLRASNEADGLHVAGLVLPPAPPRAEEEAPAPAPGAPPPRPREVRVDSLLLTGLDVRFEDRTVDPPLLLPITDLDLELDGLTSLAVVEPHAVRLDATLRAGAVRVPPPPAEWTLGPVGWILGPLDDALKKVLREQRDAPGELRPLFERVRVRCDLSPLPRPRGTFHVEVGGFQLTALQGHAAAAGFELVGGAADLDLKGEFPAEGGLQGSLLARLDDLAAFEGPNGPVRSYLTLPMPLGKAIWYLKDPRGRITVAVPLDLDAAGLERPAESFRWPIVKVVLVQLGKGVANSGRKLVGLATEPLGRLWPGRDDAPPPRPATLGFCPGDTCLRAADAQALLPLGAFAALEDGPRVVIEHTLGPADVAVLTSRVAPTPADARGVRAGLEARRASLLRARADAVAAARAALLAGLVHEADGALETARRLERELGGVELGLDEAARLFVGEAPHVRQRRLRDAARVLGNERLEAARAALLRAGVPEDRIRVAPPRFDRRLAAGEGQVVVTLEAADEAP